VQQIRLLADHAIEHVWNARTPQLTAQNVLKTLRSSMANANVTLASSQGKNLSSSATDAMLTVQNVPGLVSMNARAA
jgi:hypothetical protein